MELYKHELFRNFSPNSDNASANFFKFNLLSSRGVKPIYLKHCLSYFLEDRVNHSEIKMLPKFHGKGIYICLYWVLYLGKMDV